jgi:hypothetical protein
VVTDLVIIFGHENGVKFPIIDGISGGCKMARSLESTKTHANGGKAQNQVV